MYQENMRSVPVLILLWILTCGLYGYIWVYQTSKTLRDYSGDTLSLAPGVEILLMVLTCGLYTLYWLYKLSERIETCAAIAGAPARDNRLVFLLLGVFGMTIAAAAIAQDILNRIWQYA